MSRPIPKYRYGSQGEILPKLTADMVPSDKPVLTVVRVREFKGQDGPFLSIVFGEYPENGYDCNATQEDALLALVDAKKLPNDFDGWEGKRIPFYKKENVFSGKKAGTEPEVRAVKLYAVDPEDYDAALKAWDAKDAPSTSTSTASTGRRTARTTAR